MQGFLKTDHPTEDEINKAIKDYGFYHALPQVTRMFAEYVNHGHYGYTGGVIDQPDEYWQDMATMQWLKLWVENVKNLPRLEQVSVFDTLRQEGRIMGRFKSG